MEDDGRLIYFNVGGTEYVTRKATLEARGSNFLTQLIHNDDTGAIKTPRDRNGNLFIDRNGVVFGVLLDYFRTGQIVCPPNMQERLIFTEFDYYGVRILESPCNTVNPNDLASIVEMWRRKAADFVEKNGAQLSANLAAQLLEGDNHTVLQFTTKDGMTRIGTENIFAHKRDHLFLKFISQIMMEKYHVRAVWKSMFTMQKYYLQLVLTFELRDPQFKVWKGPVGTLSPSAGFDLSAEDNEEDN